MASLSPTRESSDPEKSRDAINKSKEERKKASETNKKRVVEEGGNLLLMPMIMETLRIESR